MKIVVDKTTREFMGITENDAIDDTDKEIVDIGDNRVEARARGVLQDGTLVQGTVFTQTQIDAWKADVTEKTSRRSQIVSLLQPLVGVNFASMTDAQRWKLVAALLYTHGIINADGVVKPLAEWKPI